MGTRADFYVGRGEQAEWLGSIAWDGYPGGIETKLLESANETQYRDRVASFLVTCRDATFPKDGWPWPWEDSNTTDYAYAFDDGKVWGSCFGSKWFMASEKEPKDDECGKVAVFPNMKDRANVTFGKRSGIIVISA